MRTVPMMLMHDVHQQYIPFVTIGEPSDSVFGTAKGGSH